jgi:hypothetical protein
MSAVDTKSKERKEGRSQERQKIVGHAIRCLRGPSQESSLCRKVFHPGRLSLSSVVGITLAASEILTERYTEVQVWDLGSFASLGKLTFDVNISVVEDWCLVFPNVNKAFV